MRQSFSPLHEYVADWRLPSHILERMILGQGLVARWQYHVAGWSHQDRHADRYSRTIRFYSILVETRIPRYLVRWIIDPANASGPCSKPRFKNRRVIETARQRITVLQRVTVRDRQIMLLKVVSKGPLVCGQLN